MLFAAAAGIGIQGGVHYGIASLVDLRTGNIVWFNQLTSTTGDLRTEKPANEAVHTLMTGLPL